MAVSSCGAFFMRRFLHAALSSCGAFLYAYSYGGYSRRRFLRAAFSWAVSVQRAVTPDFLPGDNFYTAAFFNVIDSASLRCVHGFVRPSVGLSVTRL